MLVDINTSLYATIKYVKNVAKVRDYSNDRKHEVKVRGCETHEPCGY